MSDIAIKVENLSKMYRLGVINNGTLFRDIQTWMALKSGKQDPHSKIGADPYAGDEAHFWALKDLNFEIKKGDRVGIIGKNGAGKSTLLKILSRVTTPTEGRACINGKITSLLEVGTGFHPELTGRENVYLNGAILGMRKKEIDKVFDEIIDFSGIEKHVDTPVKRYSSGMYVRLAFAVAAFLESDILIADEVLAVGDADFQKQAIGKMKDLSNRKDKTVIFVSHNIGSLKTLCSSGIILDKGSKIYSGPIIDAIAMYEKKEFTSSYSLLENVHYNNKFLKIESIEINGKNEECIQLSRSQNIMEIKICGEILVDAFMALEFKLSDINGCVVATYSPGQLSGKVSQYKTGQFNINEVINFPKNMCCGTYFGDIELLQPNVMSYCKMQRIVTINFDGVVGQSGVVFKYDECGLISLE